MSYEDSPEFSGGRSLDFDGLADCGDWRAEYRLIGADESVVMLVCDNG